MARRFLQGSTAQTMWFLRAGAMALACLHGPARAQGAPDDLRPLSPAQVALFETPHLRNVDHPETLDYGFTRQGPAGFTDKVALHVRRVNPDGTKSLAFDYLTGERQVRLRHRFSDRQVQMVIAGGRLPMTAQMA